MGHKDEVRATTAEAVEQFLAKGGRIVTDRPGQSGIGYTGKDWARAERGLKVATGEEIAAEREKRALKAVANKDFELALKLLNFEFDKVIKFDIESDRLNEGAPKPPKPIPQLHDNYGARLAAELADIPAGAWVIGVVSRHTHFYKLYDPADDQAKFAYWLNEADAKSEAVFADQATTAEVTHTVLQK